MKGKDTDTRKWFIVMNSQLEYFAGMFYGGELLWSRHYEDAKPLRLMYQNNIELITDGNYEITSYYLRYDLLMA
jgi:hypothetical protein